MQVTKRNGSLETVKFDKIFKRIQRQAKDLKNVDCHAVAQKVILGLFEGVSTTELDKLAIETSYFMSVKHPDYDKLASRLAISRLHKETESKFSDVMDKLYSVKDTFGRAKPLLSDVVYNFIKKHSHVLDSVVDYQKDYLFDYFGFKTLERSYLLKIDDKIVERPQHLYMRVACGIHAFDNDIDACLNTYQMLSSLEATHATPTLFNSGLPKNQLSSCFLVAMKDDSVPGIYNTLTECALISQSAGGIGVHIHNIRSKDSPIYGTNGKSNGIIPMLKNFNETARYIDQCFAENTIVYTSEGIKKVQDVCVGDQLISHNGNFNSVEKVLKKEFNGELISLKVKQSLRNVLVKKEHPFLVLKNQKKGTSFDVIKNRLDKNIIEPEFVEAESLTEDDLIAFPIINYEKDYDLYNEEDCRFYGLMLGDGWIHKNNSDAKLFLDPQKDDLGFVRNYLNRYLIKFSEYYKNDGRQVVFRWKPEYPFKFNRSMCYDEFGIKKMHHTMMHLSKSKSLNILKGLIHSNGHGGNEILLEMTSKNVIENIKYVLSRFGILTSGCDKNKINDELSYKNIKETISLRIPKVKDVTDILNIDEGEYVTYFTHNNFVYSRINDISLVNYNGIVYDYEVAPDHSYLTEIGLCHNGGGKRKGSFAIYLEPHHDDIFDFLDLRKNNGKEELRARDLNLALWISDLFFKRVEDDGLWSLMDPNVSVGLQNVYGEDYEKLYLSYEQQGKFVRQVKARDLWQAIMTSIIETGQPYMLSKDSSNKKSNQKNLGTIKSSNLCAEIIEYSDENSTAVCNLSSISLPSFVDDRKNKKIFNHKKLFETVKLLTENLNKIIDIEYYPVETARNSNLKHRPIGIGVQGLADLFCKLKYPWESEEAAKLNKEIFETIYYAFLHTSCELAMKYGPYESFEGSPASQGVLQFDMWGVKPSNQYNWDELKEKIKNHGLRNSLGVALMPTASTSQIMGNTESFEVPTSNIFKRATLSGEFTILNKYLVEDLIELGLWNEQMKQKIVASEGSIQYIDEIPDNIKTLYKTVWEIPQKVLMNLSADRGAFVCQSQSLNLYFKDANFAKLSSAYIYGWKKGLKTISYYTRQKTSSAQKFTVDVSIEKEMKEKQKQVEEEEIACSLDNPENCVACGS